MSSSAALTTTHLPALRAELDAWRAKHRNTPSESESGPAFTTPLADITNRFPSSFAGSGLENGGRDRERDVVVAFRTRPPLGDEAAEKFRAYEGREDGSKREEEGAGDKENENETTDAKDGEDAKHVEGAAKGGTEEIEKVAFCAGITVTDAEPGTFVAHVPGYKVRLSPFLI